MSWIFKESASFVNLTNNTDPGKQKENSAVFTVLATACKITTRDQNGLGILKQCHELANPETANKHLHALIEYGIGGSDKLKNPTNAQIDRLALVLATRILQIDPKAYHDGIANLVCDANKNLTSQHFDALMRAYEKIWQAASADSNQNLVRSMKDLLVEFSLEMPTEPTTTCPTRASVHNALKDLFTKELDVEHLKNLYAKHISLNDDSRSEQKRLSREYINIIKNISLQNSSLILPDDWLDRCHSIPLKEHLKIALHNGEIFSLTLLSNKRGVAILEEILSDSQEALGLWEALDELLKSKTDISPILKKLPSLTYYDRNHYESLLQKPEIIKAAKTAIYPDSELIHLFGNNFASTKEKKSPKKGESHVRFIDKLLTPSDLENGKHEVPDELPVQPITIPSAPELGSSLMVDDSAVDPIMVKVTQKSPLSDSELAALGKYVRSHFDSLDASIYTKFAPITTHDWNESELDKIVGSNPENKKKYQSFRDQIARQITAESVKNGIIAPCLLETYETQVAQETVPTEKTITPSGPTGNENQPGNGLERYKRFDTKKTEEEKNKQKEELNAQVENGVTLEAEPQASAKSPSKNPHLYKVVKPRNLAALSKEEPPTEPVSPMESGATAHANKTPVVSEILFPQNAPLGGIPVIKWAKDSSFVELQNKIKNALNDKYLEQMLGISDIMQPLQPLKDKASVGLLRIIFRACADVKNNLLETDVFKAEALAAALYKLCLNADQIFEAPQKHTPFAQELLNSSAAELLADAFKPELNPDQWNTASREIVFHALGKDSLNGFLKRHVGNTDKLSFTVFRQAAKDFVDRDKWYITKLYESHKRTFWTLLGVSAFGGLSWMTLKYKDWQPHANSWFWEPYAARGAQNIAHTLSPLAQLSVAQRFGFGQQRQALGTIQ